MNAGRIKRMRKRLDLTQTEFAKMCSVSYVTVNRWERGWSNPSPLAIARLKVIENMSKEKANG